MTTARQQHREKWTQALEDLQNQLTEFDSEIRKAFQARIKQLNTRVTIYNLEAFAYKDINESIATLRAEIRSSKQEIAKKKREEQLKVIQTEMRSPVILNVGDKNSSLSLFSIFCCCFPQPDNLEKQQLLSDKNFRINS